MVIGVVCFGFAWWWYYPDSLLRVVVCDVGQGDAILIQQGFNQVIIDGGPNESLLSCLGKFVPFWDKRIEMVVMTHPQADHYTALEGLLERYDVKLWLANGVISDAATFERIREKVIAENARVELPSAGKKIRIGKMEWKVVWPRVKQGKEEIWKKQNLEGVEGISPEELGLEDVNQVSVGLSLKYGQFSGLFTGDLGSAEEQALINSGVLGEYVFLKMPHHGSKYSSSTGFIRKTSPRVVVVSVGRNNGYGHPNSDIMSRYDAVGAKIYRTDKEGVVVVVSDGGKWWVK